MEQYFCNAAIALFFTGSFTGTVRAVLMSPLCSHVLLMWGDAKMEIESISHFHVRQDAVVKRIAQIADPVVVYHETM